MRLPVRWVTPIARRSRRHCARPGSGESQRRWRWVLSPCVLPLVPVVAGTALAAHPRGVFALAGGLVASFTLVGLFVASIGFAIGLDAGWFRHLAAILLIAFGVVLLSTSLRNRFSLASAPLGNLANRCLERFRA